jgi:tetratricopeptide (TPR) repeat protein
LAVARHNLAETYAALQQLPKAVEWELKAIELSANFLEGWRSLGQFYNELHSFRQAIDAFDHAANQIRRCADLLRLSVAYTGLRKFGQCDESGSAAAKLDPSRLQLNTISPFSTIFAGDVRTAYEARRKLERLDPDLADRLARLLRSRYVTDVLDEQEP